MARPTGQYTEDEQTRVDKSYRRALRHLGWRRVIAVVACVELALVVFTVCRFFQPDPSLAEIRKELDAALPPGSSQAQVEQYLMSRHWDFGKPLLADPSTDTFAAEMRIPAGTPIIVTNFIDSEGDRKVTLYFVFDGDSNLQQTLLSEFRYSP